MLMAQCSLNNVPLFELPSSLDSHRAHRNTTTRPQYDQSKESCTIYLLTRSIVESQSRGG